MDKSTPFTHPPDNNEQAMWALRDQLAELQRKHEALMEKYHDLIYQVAAKHPGESRHDTAKRYIQQAETTHDQTETNDD